MGYEYTKKSGFKNGIKGLLVRKAKLGEGVIFFGRVKGQYLGFLEIHLPFYYTTGPLKILAPAGGRLASLASVLHCPCFPLYQSPGVQMFWLWCTK